MFVDARGFLRERPSFDAPEGGSGRAPRAKKKKAGKGKGKGKGKKKGGAAAAAAASPPSALARAMTPPPRAKTPQAAAARNASAAAALAIIGAEDGAMVRMREIAETLRGREKAHNEVGETMNKANESILDAHGATSGLSTCWLCAGWRPVRAPSCGWLDATARMPWRGKFSAACVFE